MLNSASSRPLYLQIKDILLNEIAQGQYDGAGKLPSERELSKRFNVSRMTARQALQHLQQSGIIYTQIGKGTYVKDRPLHQNLEKLSSFSEDMEELGIRPHSQVLRAELIGADAEIGARLKLATDTPVVLLKRLRFANHQPVAIETAHIAHSRCPGLLNHHDFTKESLYHVLSEVYGLTLSHAEQIIGADVASPDERDLLRIAPESPAPILRIRRVTFDTKDEPVEYVKSVYHGMFYEFSVSLHATRAQVQLG
jgi:GntR family transcriptional regulator